MTGSFELAEDGIKTLMSDYFDVMHTQDMEKFDRVFHHNCVLYGVVDGELNIRPFDVYRAAVVARESPEQLGNARRDAILEFDQISPNIAWVKPQLEMFGGVMQDYLNLVRLEGEWWVMAKMWDRVGDSE
ncbi:MAG: nuclear transport factor 2 family protein [Microbacteriaceae bacterium]